jgi:hypothetical protein
MKTNHRKDLASSIFSIAGSSLPSNGWVVSADPTNPYAFVASLNEEVTTSDGTVVKVPKRFRVLVKEVD